MTPAAYYNENDPFAAQWLRNLIAAGHIMQGDVDERSIRDVRPADLIGYTRCHFFAGIAGWDYALKLAGWPEERPVWTGSCPCQPFSQAGQRKGTADDRHLWPDFHCLIGECRPATVFGEQVASKDGRAWLGGVRADLEALGYAVGGADLCAAGAGAPHIRQRLWWVADGDSELGKQRREIERRRDHGSDARQGARSSGRCALSGMADSHNARLEIKREQQARREREAAERGRAAGAWDDVEWLPCIDEKARPTQPGIFPLAHGVPGRVGQLRAYGNAIVPQVAAEFIKSVMECRP